MFSDQRRPSAIIIKLLLWLVSSDQLARDKTYPRPLRLTARGQMDIGVKRRRQTKDVGFFIFTLLLGNRPLDRRVYTGECVALRTRGPESEMQNVDIDRHSLARPRHFLQQLHRRLFFIQGQRGASDPPAAVSAGLKTVLGSGAPEFCRNGHTHKTWGVGRGSDSAMLAVTS